MTYKRNYGIIIFLVWSAAAFADFSGKVVALKDGDTLEVMRDGGAVRVRLSGIDCPEKAQAFGQRAKQFASDLAFGKTIFDYDAGSEGYRALVKEVLRRTGRT